MSTPSGSHRSPSPTGWPCDFPDHIFRPPQEAIDAILSRLEKYYEPLGHAVYSRSVFFDLGDGRLVKAGRTVPIYEARAMYFVRSYTNIPVPELFMVFEHDGCVFIVMELVDGIALREALEYDAAGTRSTQDPLIKGEDVVSVMRHLKEIVDELQELGRRFPPKDPFFGEFPAGPFKNCYTSLAHPAEQFRSVDEFHAYFLELVSARYPGTRTCLNLEKVRRESTEHAPVLTHGDLAARNLLVKGGRIVSVVDWEAFGWYPDFWEDVGISSESGALGLYEAMKRVFGRQSFVSLTYSYVETALNRALE